MAELPEHGGNQELVHIMVPGDQDAAGTTGGVILADRSYSVTAARPSVRPRKPDLLILDCNMPEVSGVLVLGELRNTLGLCDLPVMMLTGRRSAQDEHLAMFSGADAYMRKPFDPEELVFEVEQLLARHREARQPAQR